MEVDEVATLQLFERHAEAISECIRTYDGRLVGVTGDNLLAEFPSAVDAVAAAVEAQRSLARLNSARPAGGEMPFRMGIGLGEMIAHGNEIAGSRVNVAARLEGQLSRGSCRPRNGLRRG